MNGDYSIGHSKHSLRAAAARGTVGDAYQHQGLYDARISVNHATQDTAPPRAKFQVDFVDNGVSESESANAERCVYGNISTSYF